MLTQLFRHQVYILLMLVHPLLHLLNHLLHCFRLHHRRMVPDIECILQMLLLARDGHLQLEQLVIFELSFLLVCLQFPLYDVLDLQFERHAIVVDGVQNDGIGDYVAIALVRGSIVYLALHHFELLLYVVLDHFDARYNNIFENTLPLIQINLVHVVLFVQAA